MQTGLAYLLLVALGGVCGQDRKDKGFELQFNNSPLEVTNVTLNFTGQVPDWLTGTLVYNGPGLFELGNSKVTSGLDGFAKVSSWRFIGNKQLLFSSRFLNSTYRTESLAQNKFTSNIFLSPPVPALSPAELSRSQEVGIDNLDISIARFPDTKLVATNDILSYYEFDITDLSTLRKITPDLPGEYSDDRNKSKESCPFYKKLSTSHPLPEPNTNNLINILIQASIKPGESHVMKVIRLRSSQQIEVIASFNIPQVPLLHSFSVSQNKVIVLINPYVADINCLNNNAGNCFTYNSGDNTVLYIVDIRTGNVQNATIPNTFVLHHINAFELTDDQLVVDVASYNSPVSITKYNLSNLKDAKARKAVDPRADLKRITIFLSNSSAIINRVDSPTPKSVIASTLDYPVINEAYRSKQYCYAYGVAEKIDGDNAGTVGIVKKDLCPQNGRQADGVFYLEGVYPVEPTFVANPTGTDEDDGVLLVPLTSLDSGVTNLGVLNAKDLSLIDIAVGTILVPQAQHGRYYTN